VQPRIREGPLEERRAKPTDVSYAARVTDWWAVRRARSQKPSTYTCPLCGRQLHAMSDHVVIAPENDATRRRHAHTECVVAARKAGTFKTYDDWRDEQPRSSRLRRYLRR